MNPTFTTGQATLEMLAASGNPDAITYKELLSVSGATQKVSGSPIIQGGKLVEAVA